MLSEAANRDEPAINPIIYAETAIGFSHRIDLDRRLDAQVLRRLELPYEAGFTAGTAFVDYRRRGGSRTSPLPDVYIGAHAVHQGMFLLTRDVRGYRSYFPALRPICPD
jgi:predicted nucleic acid-binding protein